VTIRSAAGKAKRRLSRGLDRADGFSHLGEDAVVQRPVGCLGAPRFFVDIAAGDGVGMSNTHALVRSGWEGLSVEMDGTKFTKLSALHADYVGSRLVRARVTLENVLPLLATAEAPKDFSFLSLDIDGYGYFILDKILGEYRPALICAEINEKIPPPLEFTVLYDSDYFWDGTHFLRAVDRPAGTAVPAARLRERGAGVQQRLPHADRAGSDRAQPRRGLCVGLRGPT
jgi:hypothetical protein